MKIFSRPGKHARRKQRFPKTKYMEYVCNPNYRVVWRKHSPLDNWHYAGWYTPDMGKEVLK